MKSVLYFPLLPNANKQQIFDALCMALARTANDIPEILCCIQLSTRNHRDEVELLFDRDVGAEVYYKDYTSAELHGLWRYGTFQQLEREHFPLGKIPGPAIFATAAPLTGDIRLPALTVNANFIPGGLLLAYRLHHVAGDGKSNFLFTTALGTHFAAIRTEPTALRPAQLIPRNDVSDDTYNVTLDEFAHFKLADDGLDGFNSAAIKSDDVFTYGTYFISASKLASLKNEVSGACAETKLGKLDALSALLWSHVVAARDVDGSKYPEAKLSLTVDCRDRMKNCEIRSNYWGNFAEPNAVAVLPVESLQRGAEHATASHYVEAARRVKKALAAVDDTAVRRLNALLKQMPKATTLTWKVNRHPGPDMLLVCLQGHRYNHIYFGKELGYSSAYRGTFGDAEPRPDGRCLILPPRREDEGGLEVLLCYDHQTLDRLENDAQFARYFTRRN
ncbi:hypothetical protein NLG97_g7652 [Lecanicillium saksenae]|uniref:Uncharacterized protein n=1 Tax=Lecanicillium saksenae TaxID=468837 RepID=A0ACC1QMB3_9HYPO|nr:hypothetical protein NLG97_g7652 [Lecanicillium saksenae]